MKESSLFAFDSWFGIKIYLELNVQALILSFDANVQSTYFLTVRVLHLQTAALHSFSNGFSRYQKGLPRVSDRSGNLIVTEYPSFHTISFQSKGSDLFDTVG